MSSDVFVLVPSYNHAPFIEKALRSIIEQTFAPKKLLVIDDGSSDNSAAIIEAVLKDCTFDTELIVRPNQGLCRTLNQGYSLCDAEYFAYLGSDDFWMADFLRARVEILDRRQNAVLAYGNAYIVDESDRIIESTLGNAGSWAFYPDGDARPMLLKGLAPISSSVCYRAAALKNVEWSPNARLEDYEMYLNLMNAGDFAFDERVLSAWRKHSGNASGSRRMMLEEITAAQERVLPALGLSKKEKDNVRARTKFHHARIALQHGDKMEAAWLALGSWRAADSTAQLATFALRMLTPMWIVNGRRKLRRPGSRLD